MFKRPGAEQLPYNKHKWNGEEEVGLDVKKNQDDVKKRCQELERSRKIEMGHNNEMLFQIHFFLFGGETCVIMYFPADNTLSSVHLQ